MDYDQLPEVGQVAVVVENLDKAVQYYTKTLNMGPFVELEYKPERAILKGKEISFKFKLAFVNWGKINFEIVEVMEGEVQHKEFLKKTGGGVHHLGFYVDNMQGWIDHFSKKGVPVLLDLEGIVGPRGRRRAVFFDTSPGSVLFEFIQIL